jgi:DNA integrity scanning protein DisA with diadenylate cyclase activity
VGAGVSQDNILAANYRVHLAVIKALVAQFKYIAKMPNAQAVDMDYVKRLDDMGSAIDEALKALEALSNVK